MNAIIPARAGSKGIPNKNICDVSGYPLIAYSIVAAQKCELIDEIFVSTDSKKIASIAQGFGANIIIRPDDISQDSSTDLEFLLHYFDLHDDFEVALLRPTTPLRDPQVLEHVIVNYYQQKNSLSSLRTVNKSKTSPYKMFNLTDDYCKGFFKDFAGNRNYTNLPRQTFPQAYIGNGICDIIKQKTVRSGSTFGDKIYPAITDSTHDIDIWADLDYMNYYLDKNGHILLDVLNERLR